MLAAVWKSTSASTFFTKSFLGENAAVLAIDVEQARVKGDGVEVDAMIQDGWRWRGGSRSFARARMPRG